MHSALPVLLRPPGSPVVDISSHTIVVPPEVIEIVRTLRDQGFPTFLVGGALRDALLGKARHDWDVATAAPCEKLLRTFSRVIPVGVRHGSVRVRVPGQWIDVSTFRGEGILEDLRHRDFTINALAYDPSEARLIDPFDGLRDLQARRLRAVEDPMARFHEDPLRTIRAIRIAAEIGFSIHRGTWRCLRCMVGGLSMVAPERVREEFTRSLMTETPSRTLHRMRQSGIVGAVIPELLEGNRMAHTAAICGSSILTHTLETVDYLPSRATLRWAGLLHEVGKPRARKRIRRRWLLGGHARVSAQAAENILKRLRFSRRDIAGIVHLIRYHDLRYSRRWSDAAVRRLVMKVGLPWLDDLLSLSRADRIASRLPDEEVFPLEELAVRIQEIVRSQGGTVVPRPALTGRDVMRVLDIPAGPHVGRIVRALQQRVAEVPASNTREDLSYWLLNRYVPALLGPDGN